MTKRLAALLSLALLAGSATAEDAPQADAVLQAFQAAGLPIENIREEPRDPAAPLPNSYNERKIFAHKGIPRGKGGQIFTCTRVTYCDAIYSYYDALKALGGPYYYRSKSGLVVAQLNSGLQPKDAEVYERVLQSF